jgi:hypothetical protein
VGSPQRSKVRLVVDVGPLVGKAIAIVGSTDREYRGNQTGALRPMLVTALAK